jgi:hypothetical protein
MNDFKLTIGNPIPMKINPSETFELTVSYMHGDADSYSKESWRFLNLDDYQNEHSAKFTLRAALDILTKYKKADMSSLGGIGYSELAKVLDISPDVIDAASNCDFFPGDCTCDHQCMAMFDGYELVWWDENRIKHEVKVST